MAATKAVHPIKPGDVYVTCASAEVVARFHVAVPGMANRLAMSVSTTLDKPGARSTPSLCARRWRRAAAARKRRSE
jgi:hypothetical protein